MKDLIRKEILARRKAMDSTEVSGLSLTIFRRLTSSSIYADAASLMVYLDFRNEVQTGRIIEHSLALGKRVFVPVCVPETRQLVVSELLSLEELEAGAYGILEPKGSALRLSDRELIELVLVPGAAFDRKGNRLGYGAGYYDSFFAHMRHRVCKTALAFSLQLAEEIPAGELDIPMDYIFTESELISCAALENLT